MRPYRNPIGVFLVLLFPVVTSACLWDVDTLKQERERFPGTLELITGKFLRHSPEFYAWRIQDRLKKLKVDPSNLGYHDDLAVAYSKIGKPAEAIAILEAKERIKPGLYETYSNLGTIHILAGELERGLPYIDRALAINPNAHFGREKYQKWLVEYAISRKDADGKLKFPLGRRATKLGERNQDFCAFIASRKAESKSDRLGGAEAQAAMHGVLGMMRFANHDHPLLLEALGDLLHAESLSVKDAKQLAMRSYLKASYAMSDSDARAAYRERALAAKYVVSGEGGDQRGLIDPTDPDDWIHQRNEATWELEEDFKKELVDAEHWYGTLKAREIGWVRDGGDVEKRFNLLYSAAPKVIAGEAPASKTKSSKAGLDQVQQNNLPK